MTGLSPLRLGLTADVKTYCERSNFIVRVWAYICLFCMRIYDGNRDFEEKCRKKSWIEIRCS